MMNEEEYEKLMATLERIEKAGTLSDIVRLAPDPNWDDTATANLPFVDGPDAFERIHNSSLLSLGFAIQRLEKEASMVKYFDRYCKNLYENYKSQEKMIKHPDILKFIKDYENYYKGGEK